MSDHPVRLSRETSPYLLQHATNPVDWYPWGPEALQKAKEENKPIFLSIGYSSCHWCHVMAQECFENHEIAALMNQWFINIKVDREEHPDIDSLYMKALVEMTGQGGWPLSIFLTPDQKPYLGGTYFPPTPKLNRPGFPQVLEEAHQLVSKGSSLIHKKV
ncbi:MAG: thioredoxin domain-containing protein, partial [Nitrospinota bacterium]|nr:thioredoxin domain-containing protein [Nitrospinota bacterium]